MQQVTANETTIARAINEKALIHDGSLSLMLQYASRAMRLARKGDMEGAAVAASLAAGFGASYDAARMAEFERCVTVAAKVA